MKITHKHRGPGVIVGEDKIDSTEFWVILFTNEVDFDGRNRSAVRVRKSDLDLFLEAEMPFRQPKAGSETAESRAVLTGTGRTTGKRGSSDDA